jgi:hypothetical protein
MATFMDISLFANLGPIFMFLLVFAIVFGILSVSKIFKNVAGEKGIYGIIALVAGLFVLVSKDTFMIIGTMTPWFTALIVFMFLVFVVVRMFVGDDTDLFSNMIKEGPLKWVMIVLFIIILIIALSSTFGQQMLDDDPLSQQAVPASSTAGVLPSTQATTQQIVVIEASGASSTATVPAQSTGTASSEDFSANVLATFVHPKVLGMLLLLLIGFFAVLLLARSNV